MNKLFALLLAIGLCAPYTSAQALEAYDTTIVLSEEVLWTPLNPARGDKSPQAGILWGDRNKTVATGFLVKFKDGFASPPHIHNVTYRGLVINGLVHNAAPMNKSMWMPTGSFWTQPAGEAHITAAKGQENIAYIEIDSGPYLVAHENEAFDNGERAINVHSSNIVWLGARDTTYLDHKTAELAFLWRDNERSGTLMKIPANTKAKLHIGGSEFQSVVIAGTLHYHGSTLKSGSYFAVSAPSAHSVTSSAEDDLILYVRSDTAYQVKHDRGSDPHE